MLKSVSFLVIFAIGPVLCSKGDQSWVFQRCSRSCLEKICTVINDERYDKEYLPFYMRWLRWDCFDECNYECMWKTVHAYEQDKTREIPQFFGKWPFIRFLGLQEPASALFSFFNAAAHVFMLYKFRKIVPSSVDMYWVWHSYAFVAVIAWICATVFHARDFMITEMADYFSAVGLVVISVWVLTARVIGMTPYWKPIPFAVGLLAWYIYHMRYLYKFWLDKNRFDYSYNMQATITCSVLNAIGWLAWCGAVYKKQPYVWKCAFCLFTLAGLVLFEVYDFPPIYWVFDAHSLWHLGTIPVTFVWYQFAIDDCLFLKQSAEGSAVDSKEAAVTEDNHEQNKKDS